jgi:hypothetical protein
MGAEMEKAWADACRVLLGEEIGSLSRCRDYLLKHVDKVELRPSSISGKQVAFTAGDICPSARFIGNDEAEEYLRLLKADPIPLNEMKDADSLFRAVGERFRYSGSIVLGNSSGVENSNRCMNASFVKDSTDIYDSRYVAFSSGVRYGEWIFGSNWIGETKFSIKNYETLRDVRCMETITTYNSSDCYFTGHIDGCSNCMFTFNVRNKSNMIGNVQLSRQDYAKLKGKLLGDMRQMFKTRKEIPTLIDVIGE